MRRVNPQMWELTAAVVNFVLGKIAASCKASHHIVGVLSRVTFVLTNQPTDPVIARKLECPNKEP